MYIDPTGHLAYLLTDDEGNDVTTVNGEIYTYQDIQVDTDNLDIIQDAIYENTQDNAVINKSVYKGTGNGGSTSNAYVTIYQMVGVVRSYIYGVSTAIQQDYTYGLVPDTKNQDVWDHQFAYYNGKDLGHTITTGISMIEGSASAVGGFVTSPTGVGAIAGSAGVVHAGTVIVSSSANSLADDLMRSQILNADRSQHAQQRAQEGRPVGAGSGDAQNAKRSDVLIQEDGRWIVKGDNGRISVFEPNGEQVTTFKNPAKNTEMRIQDGRWSRPTESQLEEFAKIFNNGRIK